MYMNKTGILVFLSFMVIIAIMISLTSCCMSVCNQDAPELTPLPECGIYYVEDIIELPVETQNCK